MLPDVAELESNISLSAGIRNNLAAMIRQQKFPPGAQLPSVRKIAKHYKVSTRTVARALDLLKNEHLVIARNGIGAFVAAPAKAAVAAEIILCMHPDYLKEQAGTWAVFARLEGVMAVARQHGAPLFTIVHGYQFDLYLHPQARQGLILMDRHYETDGFGGIARYAVEHEWPVCVVGEAAVAFPSVNQNRDTGLELAVAHLVALGHQRVALINGPIDSSAPQNSLTTYNIRKGFLRGLKRAGLGLEPQFYVETPMPELDGPVPTVKAVEMLISRTPGPTAIVCNNDARALRVIETLKAHGLRVPQDVSVVGCDNSPESAKSDPPLTTIDMQVGLMGEEAARYILNRLEGLRAPLASVIPRLVVRASSDGPRAE